ncbi:MAG: CBS domain-containing protein [Bacteriovoracaceae bacterium]
MKSSLDFANLKVEEYTTPSPFSIRDNAPIPKVLQTMQDKEVRHLPVTNSGGDTIGIISDRDLSAVKSFAFKADLKAKDIMTPDPVSVNVNSGLLEAAYEMSRRKIGSLIVNDNEGQVYGIFTNTDALNALVEILRGDVEGE